MEKTIQPGIYRDMPNEEYHAGPGVSNSGLTQIARSPAHYWSGYLDPHRERRPPTPAMEFGTAVHTAILEPERFAAEFIVAPADAPRRPTDVQRNAKKPSDATIAAAEFWQRFDDENKGRTIMAADDFAACLRVRRSVELHPAADLLLASGNAELSMYWTDDDSVDSPLCKCRPDFFNSEGWIVDVKTTEDARQDAFARSCWNYRYYVQAAWYLEGVERCTGTRPAGFVFVAVEKSPPYALAVYAASRKMVMAGAAEFRRNIETLRACLASGEWPAYPDEIVSLDLPSWAEKINAKQVI